MHDLGYWCFVGVCILFGYMFALFDKKFQHPEGNAYQNHIRKYPGGVTFSSSYPNRYKHGLTYFDIFRHEFQKCLPTLGGRLPTYDELVECINSIHPDDSKDDAIGYLITAFFHLSTDDYIRLFHDTSVDVDSFNLYTHVLFHVIKDRMSWCYTNPTFLETVMKISRLGYGGISMFIPLEIMPVRDDDRPDRRDDVRDDADEWGDYDQTVVKEIEAPHALVFAFCLGAHNASPDMVCSHLEWEFGYDTVVEIKTRLEKAFTAGNIAFNSVNTLLMLNALDSTIETYCKRQTLFGLLWRHLVTNCVKTTINSTDS